MGMTRCGRFLMTYSSQAILIDDDCYDFSYKYKLHWWKFENDGLAKEVDSIPLFNGKPTYSLRIYFCQWPKYDDKVLVYGLE